MPPVPPSSKPTPSAYEKFDIRHVEVKGNTVFTDAEIGALVKPLEGREVSLREIETVRQAITRYYIDHGYINSGAVIPANGYVAGVLHMTIEEGLLDEIKVTGAERLRPAYIKNRLLPEAAERLHLPTVQERFQLLLSDPLIRKLNGRVLPGTKPGHAILDVEVTRARPYQLSIFTDNHRPPSIGAEVFGVTGWVRNLSGRGDLLDFTFTTGAGSDRYSGGLRIPVTDSGTEAYIRFDEGDSAVIEAPTHRLDIQSRIHTLEGGFSHPVINTLRERLALGIAFGVRENETSLGGSPFTFVRDEPTGHNQSTVVRMTQDYLRRWDADVVSLRSTFSVGLDALGSTQPVYATSPSSKFFAWLGQLQYAHRFTDDGWQAVVRGTVQLTDAPLLPLEQMSVGGVGTVRGYRENQLVRDQGYTLSAELRIPLWRGADSADQVQLVPFVDHGQAWNLDQPMVSLTSVGIGLSADYGFAHGELYYGYGFDRPEGAKNDDLQDHGIHFQARLDAF